MFLFQSHTRFIIASTCVPTTRLIRNSDTQFAQQMAQLISWWMWLPYSEALPLQLLQLLLSYRDLIKPPSVNSTAGEQDLGVSVAESV